MPNSLNQYWNLTDAELPGAQLIEGLAIHLKTARKTSGIQ